MVSKDEFGQLVAEFESFRDMTLEEIGKFNAEIEKLKEQINDILKETKTISKKRIG